MVRHRHRLRHPPPRDDGFSGPEQQRGRDSAHRLPVSTCSIRWSRSPRTRGWPTGLGPRCRRSTGACCTRQIGRSTCRSSTCCFLIYVMGADRLRLRRGGAEPTRQPAVFWWPSVTPWIVFFHGDAANAPAVPAVGRRPTPRARPWFGPGFVLLHLLISLIAWGARVSPAWSTAVTAILWLWRFFHGWHPGVGWGLDSGGVDSICMSRSTRPKSQHKEPCTKGTSGVSTGPCAELPIPREWRKTHALTAGGTVSGAAFSALICFEVDR